MTTVYGMIKRTQQGPKGKSKLENTSQYLMQVSKYLVVLGCNPRETTKIRGSNVLGGQYLGTERTLAYDQTLSLSPSLLPKSPP